MDLAGLLKLLRAPAPEVSAVFRVGSRVYGTASPASDEDFVAVLSRAGARQDLLFAEGINVIVHDRSSFQRALERQSVLVLECFFAPREHRLHETGPVFCWSYDAEKLAAAALTTSDKDFHKAERIFDDEPDAARKKLFHSLRVLLFALEIARTRRLADFTMAAPLWRAIAAHPASDWPALGRRFGPERDRLLADLSRLAKAKR